MTIEETSNQLRKDAIKIIETIQLEKILSPFGKFKIVGSLSYDLMSWRDIDIDLITSALPNDADYWKIVPTLFAIKNITSINLADNRNQTEKNRPKSMYIGLNYLDENHNKWKIDIRILTQKDVTSNKIENLIIQKMNAENRRTILEIKSQVCDNPNYHKTFSSADIYEAVLQHNVKTTETFIEYLSQIGKLF